MAHLARLALAFRFNPAADAMNSSREKGSSIGALRYAERPPTEADGREAMALEPPTGSIVEKPARPVCFSLVVPAFLQAEAIITFAGDDLRPAVPDHPAFVIDGGFGCVFHGQILLSFTAKSK